MNEEHLLESRHAQEKMRIVKIFDFVKTHTKALPSYFHLGENIQHSAFQHPPEENE